MDILVIAPTPYFSDRGCHIRIYEEAAALQKVGYRPIIFTYHLGRDLGSVPVHRISPVRWYSKTSAGPAWGKLYLDWKLFWLIIRKRKQYSFKIIHAHLHEGAWLGWWLKHVLHIPLVLDAQGSLTGEMQAHDFFTWPGLKNIFQYIERFIIRVSDAIVVSSRGLYEFMDTQFVISRGKTELLADAVSFTQFSHPLSHLEATKTSPEAIRQKLHIASDEFVLLYTGGLSRIKGIQYLLEAMPEIMQRASQLHPQEKPARVRLVMIGYGNDAEWKAYAKQLGVMDHVLFVGQLPYDQLALYLRMADLAIDPKPPQAHESSGKLLNYMAAGLPVIAFASSSTQAMLANTGHIVTELSATALARAILELMNDDQRRMELGQSARYRISQHFNWDERITTLTAVYERLAK